jgi:MarR family transcriptional regulator, transcriptional regulator for hemolysin
MLISWCLEITKSYDLENSIGFMLYRTAMAFRKALDLELRRKTGVTFGQWKILTLLSRQDGLSQREIADRLEVEGPTLIPIIDKMESKGLLTRKVDPEDRRNNRIFLTQITDSKWDSLVNCSMHVRKTSVKGIPDDQVKAMGKVLETISKNLVAEYGVDHNCNIKSITSATTAASNSNRKEAVFKRGTD